MDVILGVKNIKPRHRDSVVTIGNFDGVHRGHQTMIQAVINEAHEKKTLAGLITFEPHPVSYFHPVSALRLTPFREKYQWLKELGLDFLLVLPFNTALAQKSAQEFVENILVAALQVRSVWVGEDFHFGKGREGNFTLLQQLATMNGFLAQKIPSVAINHQRISSTRIREALKQGDLAGATLLLGHRYVMSGRVQRGAARGKLLGFPTANIRMISTPFLSGVFVVQITSVLWQGVKNGVANIGTRPTVDGKSLWLEIYIFDFSGDLYGERLTVTFLEKLRDEKKFDSLEALTTQIRDDIKQANTRLSLDV